MKLENTGSPPNEFENMFDVVDELTDCVCSNCGWLVAPRDELNEEPMGPSWEDVGGEDEEDDEDKPPPIVPMPPIRPVVDEFDDVCCADCGPMPGGNVGNIFCFYFQISKWFSESSTFFVWFIRDTCFL